MARFAYEAGVEAPALVGQLVFGPEPELTLGLVRARAMPSPRTIQTTPFSVEVLSCFLPQSSLGASLCFYLRLWRFSARKGWSAGVLCPLTTLRYPVNLQVSDIVRQGSTPLTFEKAAPLVRFAFHR